MQKHQASVRTRRAHADEHEYRLYTAVLFPVAFCTVLVHRLLPQPRSPYVTSEDQLPFLSEVMELCRSAVPWVFMGR